MPTLSKRLRLPDDASGYARLRLRLTLLGVVVITAFAASTAYDAWRSYRHAVLSTERELANLASALAEQTAWTWQGTDLLMKDVAHWYPGREETSAESIDGFLANVAARLPQVHSLRIIDAGGILRNSSNELDKRGVDLSDRAYFQAQEKDAAQELFVSEPVLTRSEGRTAVLLSRRLEDSQGRFAGVVSANVDLEDLSRLYAAVDLRGNIAIHLLREDGALLTRSPPVPTLAGHLFPALVAVDADAVSRIRSPFDGEREFIAVAPVRDVPLVIATARNETAALATSYQETIHGAVRSLLLALFGALTLVVLMKQLRRIEQTDLALRQSQKMEAVGTLAGGIAHDFNNILGAIVGYGELAQEQAPEGSALRRYLDNIMHAACRARALVDRILGFSRSGLAEQVPIAIQGMVAETLELLQASLPANIRLEKDLSAPDAALIGDETRLHQVTMNLCTNAAQAMPEGGVLRVTLKQLRLAAPRTLSRGQLAAGAYVLVTVGDSGIGIPPEILQRIFDPFFTTKRVGEGTGLGLSLVDGIVADLGGAIEVSSVMGEGTTFRIWLPTTAELPKPSAGTALELPRGNGESVMIVDDEPALLLLTEEMLAQLGYEPVGFASGSAALQAFQADPDRFEVVLTDEMMPGVRGTELARELNALRPGVPIIVMSGHGGPQLAERAAAAGVRDVLRKPLQKRDLAESLAKLLAGASDSFSGPVEKAY